MSSNPLFESNETFISVHWSPPFLWPGRAIQSYDIILLFVNETDESATYHKINSSFSDRVVSFTKELQEESIMKCTKITVNVTALSARKQQQVRNDLNTFSVSKWILPSGTHAMQ